MVVGGGSAEFDQRGASFYSLAATALHVESLTPWGLSKRVPGSVERRRAVLVYIRLPKSVFERYHGV